MVAGAVFFKAKKVAVQRKNDRRLLELVTWNDGRSKSLRGTVVDVGSRNRLENVPVSVGQDRTEVLAKQIKRRRDRVFAEDSQPFPFLLADCGVVLGGKGVVIVPRGSLTLLEHWAGAIRIVELQNRGLGKRVGGASAVGLSGVAFDLGRPSLVALNQNREGRAAARHRRGIEVRQSRHHPLRRFCVRQYFLLGPATSRQPGQTQRSCHQLQESSTVNAPGKQLPDGLGKSPLDPVTEFRCVGELIKTAPVRLAGGECNRVLAGGRFLIHRWHPTHCSGA